MTATQNIPQSNPFGAAIKGWRRSRRLSQLDLAMLGELSRRHLSFLESGRVRPSRDMVLKLADALDVPLREQNGLLQAAGFAAGYRHRALDDADMTPVRKALELLPHHHEPYPALVIDRDWNLLLINQAMQSVFSLLGNPDRIWSTVCVARGQKT